MIRIEQFKGTVYEKEYGNVAKIVMVDKKISIGQELNISENIFWNFKSGERELLLKGDNK